MNRNTAIILTVASTILCGCPGLFAILAGLSVILASFFPGQEIIIGPFRFVSGSDPWLVFLGWLCLGVILIAIPVAVGFVTLRRKMA